MSSRFEERVRDLFEEARGLSAEGRAAFLEDECEGDAALRAEVEELLAMDGSGTGFLEDPPVRLGDSTLNEAAPIDVPEVLALGDELGPYRILRSLGVGGMGTVWLAHQEEPVRRDVALKVIKLGMDTARVVARFEQERQTLARMSHPGIARVFDAGSTAEGRPYFVMEYVEGVPLGAWRRDSQPTLHQKLRLVIEVCAAVQHAHQKGVVHRDLKPSNILVVEGATGPEPKVIDFGVAKVTGTEGDEEARLTRAGLALGTPEYMAPEQFRGSRSAADTRSDIFSLGVLLYELLTGALPRKQPTSTVVVRPSKRAQEAGDAPLARALQGDLDWILLKALEPEPELRYASAEELAADLRRHLADEPVLAGPPSAAYRVSKFVRRHRLPVALAAAALLLLVVGLVGMTWSWQRVRSARALADTRLEDVLRLSDLYTLDRLREEADTLWPARPERVPGLRAWLERADDLLARTPGHERRLAVLEEARVAQRADGLTVDPTLEWERGQLERLLATLHDLASEDPRVSVRADVERRIRLAAELENASLVEGAQAWREAIASIRDPDQCPAYGGLELTPQFGLLPLGRDPDSGLWEFAHLQSGEPATRDEDGRFVVRPETGVVLVLLPGGTFAMGASPEPGESWMPADPLATPDEAPVRRVTLDPFFVSKYELTREQWLRATGESPSVNHIPPPGPSDCLPVESVSWEDCTTTLHDLDLAIPAEAQWEYAARAGTAGPWGSVRDPSRIVAIANLAGTERRSLANDSYHDPLLHDDFPTVAPVGCFEPNPFGLYDTLGNVWELCLDTPQSYDVSPAAGTGERQGEGSSRVGRGGSYRSSHAVGRVSKRNATPPDAINAELGIRPVRRVELER